MLSTILLLSMSSTPPAALRKYYFDHLTARSIFSFKVKFSAFPVPCRGVRDRKANPPCWLHTKPFFFERIVSAFFFFFFARRKLPNATPRRSDIFFTALLHPSVPPLPPPSPQEKPTSKYSRSPVSIVFFFGLVFPSWPLSLSASPDFPSDPKRTDVCDFLVSLQMSFFFLLVFGGFGPFPRLSPHPFSHSSFRLL